MSWVYPSLHQASLSCDCATWMLHSLNCISMNAAHIVVIERHAVLLMVVALRLVVLTHHVLLLHVVILILIDPGLVLQNLDCLLSDTQGLWRCPVILRILLLLLLLLLRHLIERVKTLVLEGCLLVLELGVKVLLIGVGDVGLVAGATVVGVVLLRGSSELVVVTVVIAAGVVVSLHDY